MEEISVGIIGSGNVAAHLLAIFSQKGISVEGLWARNTSKALKLATENNCIAISSLKDFSKETILFVCISDNSLTHFDVPNATLISVSGNFDIHSSNAFAGVFYPLQTFHSEQKVNWKNTPIFIESEDENLRNSLVKLAHLINAKPIIASVETRQKIHLTAVYVNNFTNLILSEAKDIAKKNHLDFNWFEPLLTETISKRMHLNGDLQTGPAKRGDYSTIQNHLQQLSSEEKELYFQLSNSLLKKYNHEQL